LAWVARRIAWVLFITLMSVTGPGSGPVWSLGTVQAPTKSPQLRLAYDTRVTASSGAAQDEVLLYEEQVAIPTYPYARYQSDAIDPIYRWPYKRMDMERFRREAPSPQTRTYRLLVLENSYLKLLILPELGGRIWQVIHKPSGAPMFYQNSVVKPTHWGQANQLGWLALGGLEWGLPVIEHGYDWGVPWQFDLHQNDKQQAAVRLFTPHDGRLLYASITVSLRAGEAMFMIEPQLTNLSQQPLTFSFWLAAMLAPGSGKRPSAQLHFVLPSQQVMLHSAGDATLPAAQATFSWPRFQGRNLSQLGEWRQYLGFFEAPSAHGPFAGVYDPFYDAGAVRVFPADRARGSKIFALGWHDALASDNYTDDQSMYVELHGGLAPSFFEETHLPARGTIGWREVWYPVQGIGDLSVANERGALSVRRLAGRLEVGFYPTRPLRGTLVVASAGKELWRAETRADPVTPIRRQLKLDMLPNQIEVRIEDETGRILLMSRGQG
jgi:hypothetical protein